MSVIAIDFVSTFFGQSRSVWPTFARDIFEAGPQGFGWLSAAPAVGGLIGVTLAFALGDIRRKGIGVIICTFGFGISVLGFSQAPGLFWACVGLAGYGLVDAVGDTMRHTLLQTETANEYLGRVHSVSIMLGSAGPQLGQFWLGFLASVLGPRQGVGLGAGVIIFFAVGLLVFARPLVQHGMARPSLATLGPDEQLR